MLKHENKLRVFADTNVFIDAIMGNQASIEFFQHVCTNNQLVLSTSVLQEFFQVIDHKFPEQARLAREFLDFLDCEIVPTPVREKILLLAQQIPLIRDPDDVHVLVSCWLADCDLLVTQDKHFHTTRIRDQMKVLRTQDYLCQYGLNDSFLH